MVLFFGPPGSGKGTQAKKLSLEKGWPQLSTGDMLRAAIQESSSIGLRAKSFMDRGELVPDQVVIELIAERICHSDCAYGFILDGFPRNRSQAVALNDLLALGHKQIDFAIYFKIEQEQLILRLSGRRICLECRAMYHIQSAPPKLVGICDFCGKKLVQRVDDQPEVIQNRLVVYYQETEPLVEFYRTQNKLEVLNAGQTPEAVALDLMRVLK